MKTRRKKYKKDQVQTQTKRTHWRKKPIKNAVKRKRESSKALDYYSTYKRKEEERRKTINCR